MARGWETSGLPWPWREVVDSEEPATASFSGTESADQMIIDVDMTGVGLGDLSALPAAILGYPVYSPFVTPAKLSRFLPWRNPKFNRMWAAKIVSMRGRPGDDTHGFKATDSVSGLSCFQYSSYRLVIQFGTPPFAVLSDSAIGGFGNAREFYRYVEKGAELNVENIIKKGSQFYWAQVTPTTTGNLGLPVGQAATDTLPFGVIIRSGKAMLKWTWHQVPGTALFGADGTDIPTNIFNAIGKVNDAAFPDASGFPAGTLLFLPPKFIAEDAPIEPSYMGLPPGYPPRVYRVEMPVSYYNPARFPNWNSSGTDDYPYKGHNLVPSPATAAMPYFYLVTADSANGTSANNLVFQSYDYNKIFQLP